MLFDRIGEREPRRVNRPASLAAGHPQMSPRRFQSIGMFEGHDVAKMEIARQIDDPVRAAKSVHQLAVRDQHEQFQRTPLADYLGAVFADAPPTTRPAGASRT